MIPGAGHGLGRRVAGAAWDERVGAFLRGAFGAAREPGAALGILAPAERDEPESYHRPPNAMEADQQA
jgi:hypothetical protein